MATEYINEQARISYVDLPAIIAGTLLTLAISLVLLHFGSVIGLAASYETRWTGNTAIAAVIVGGLWLLWVQILASIAGGYIAGRMRKPVAGASEHEREMRDGMHGLLVWATGTVAVAIGMAWIAAISALANEPQVATPEKTQEMLDMERNTAIIFAFVTAATSFVSAAAAWWGATQGGEHRDKNVDHSRYVSFRK